MQPIVQYIGSDEQQVLSPGVTTLKCSEIKLQFWLVSGGCVICRELSAASLVRKQAEKKVLLLGAGYVSAPVVDYLTRDSKYSVTVGKQ